ncbi:MAG TPA: hypothetical protein VG603_11795 [Chitinophagales bacterium]|nr:hypothetical protein [Chitinophagales bacterium]
MNRIFILALISLALGGCIKKGTDYSALSKDAALSQSITSDVFKTIDNEAKNGNYSSTVGKTDGTYQSQVDTCATITLNTNGGNFPMTLTLDFGSGCTDVYGVNRKGKLICTFSGRYTQQGSVITVTTDNYYVNGYKVEGTKTITNSGRNSDNKMYFTVVDQDGKITHPDGKVSTWTSNYTQTWIAGEGTTGLFGICDDTYSFDGTVQGVAVTGDSYRLQSSSPLIKNACCYWVSGGVIDIYVNNSMVASVNYGDGNCDATATVTYGGKDYVVYIQ